MILEEKMFLPHEKINKKYKMKIRNLNGFPYSLNPPPNSILFMQMITVHQIK